MRVWRRKKVMIEHLGILREYPRNSFSLLEYLKQETLGSKINMEEQLFHDIRKDYLLGMMEN